MLQSKIIMLLTECIKLTVITLFILSIILLIIAIKNKDKNACYWISVTGAILIIYIHLSIRLTNQLEIPISFGSHIFYYLVEIIVRILCITLIIISCIKAKKLKSQKKNKHIKYIILAFIILPIIPVSIGILNNLHTINHSNLIVVYRSAGNGGFGNIQYFAYGINNDSCKEFDLGINLDGYRLNNFLPPNAKKTALKEIPEYDVRLTEDRLVVYKDTQQICSVSFQSHYYNNSLEKTFYIEH